MGEQDPRLDPRTVEDFGEGSAVGKKWILTNTKQATATITVRREKGQPIRKTSDKQKKELIRYFESNPGYGEFFCLGAFD